MPTIWPRDTSEKKNELAIDSEACNRRDGVVHETIRLCTHPASLRTCFAKCACHKPCFALSQITLHSACSQAIAGYQDAFSYEDYVRRFTSSRKWTVQPERRVTDTVQTNATPSFEPSRRLQLAMLEMSITHICYR
eukprot:6204639-Pleurochrysis_carterae.AAC.2